MSFPLDRIPQRRWAVVWIVFATVYGWTRADVRGQEPAPPTQPAQPGERPKTPRQRATTPRKSPEPKPADAAPQDAAKEAVPAPTVPPPAVAPQPVEPTTGAPAGIPGRVEEVRDVVKPQPEGVQDPGASETPKKPEDGETDAAKRVEEARKAAAQRAAARRSRTGGDAATPPGTGQPTTPGAIPPSPTPFNPPPDLTAEGQHDPSGPSTTLNIAPVESSIPPEQREYGFSIKDGTYEDLIAGFARQTGLGVIGDAPKDGKCTFITTEKLTFDSALARVRMLLFNYKPNEPYWILREENNLKVVRVTDVYRILSRDRMFSSVDEFRRAGLSVDELALVIYTPKSGSVADLRQVRDFLPDYVRVTPLEDQNRVSIFALVSDIEKYLGLIDFFAGSHTDPRTIKRIEVHHLLANDAITKLRSLMDLDGGGVPGKPAGAAASKRAVQPSALDSMAEPPVSIIADDVQGILIVRAMQSKIDEMEMLLPLLDVDTSSATARPVVIKVLHVDANEMISTVQQILGAGGGAGAAPVPKARKTKRGSSTTPATPPPSSPSSPGGASSDSITMFPHPSDNAIIVLADEEGVARVRELVAQFDVPARGEPVRIPLAHADANEVLNTVTAVMGAPARAGKPALDRFTLIVDPTGDALWFSGTETDLGKVRELIAMVDTPDAPVSLRTVICVYQQASFLADMLREFDNTNPGSAAPAAATKKPKTKRARAAPASKFTPNDAQKKLFIVCTDDEWTRYESLIRELDRPADMGEAFVRLPVEHIDTNAAIERLNVFFSSAKGAEPAPNLVAGDGAILAVGVDPQEVDRIKVFLREIDKPTTFEKRTFEIRHANAADIKAAIETLIADMPATAAPRKRGKGEAGKGGGVGSSVSPEMTIVQLGQKLIVQTTPDRMEEVAKLVEEFDVEEAKTELKVYADFPPGTNIEGISDTIQSVFTSTGKGGKRAGREGAAGGEALKLIPQPASGRLVAIAEPSLFPEIERLLTVLRHEVESRPTVVAFLEVKHADADELVEIIKPLLDIKIRGLVESGELEDAGEETVVAPTKGSGRRRGASGLQAATGDRYHLSPDSRNKRIVVAAPQLVIDQVRTLVQQFDIPGQQPIFKTVELTNAEPAEMVQAVKEMMGRPVSRKSAAGKPGKATTSPALEFAGEGQLTVVEAPGGGAIVLHGHPSDVTRAEDWIRQLDGMSTRGRVIKVYDIKNADMEKLFDLIVNVVGASTQGGAGKAALRGAKKRAADEDEEDEPFSTTRTHAGPDLYIQADLIGHTMMVASTPSKINEIDDIVKRVDSDPEVVKVMEKDKAVASFVYELQDAEATDASWELEAVLKSSVWRHSGELPKVEPAPFGNSIIVEYPYEDRFDEIRELIRKYADKPDPIETKIIRRSNSPPPGLSAKETVVRLMMNHPEYEFDLVDIASKKDETYGVEQLTPLTEPAKIRPCVLPAALDRLAAELLAGAVGQPPPAKDDQPETLEEDVELEDEPIEEFVPIPGGDDMIRQATESILREKGKGKQKDAAANGVDEKKPSESKDGKSDRSSKKPSTGERLKIYYDDQNGVFVIEGPKKDLEDVDDWMDDLKKEIEDFPVKPDIRIYRVRYIDVHSAQDILEEMFNATKQQMASVQQQQQQAMRQQQLAQQRAQGGQPGARGQGEEPQGPGGPGAPGAPGRGLGMGRFGAQPGQVPGAQLAVPQLPPAGVRIYANPRDRTLILRAETSQYPQILELLATIDQPKPIDSVMRTYPLKNLNAVEVEDILREWLGLGKDGAKPRGARAQGQPGAPGLGAPSAGPGEQLPKTILQKTVTGLSELGVDPEHIKLFSSEISNSIMAMAPEAALDYIGDLVRQIDSEDVAKRLTKYYELKNADAEDAAAYLENHFAEKERNGKARKGGGEGAASASGGKGLNSPSFVPYSRLNLLTVHATQVQLDEIDGLITRIDVKGEQDKWEDVTLAHADAKLVADTLTQMFVEKGGAGAAGGKPSGRSGAAAAKFIGEAGGGIVLFSASKPLHEQIRTTIAKLDDKSKETRTPRIIELKNAKASAVADAIEKAYDPKPTGGKSAVTPRFSVTAHDPTKRLFVIADNVMFKEVESLAKLLDDKPGGIGAEFRIYPLTHASAKIVHGQLKKLMQDYMSRLGPGASGIDAFSVEPEETSNSLLVLGGPTVFGFIEENLRKIDVPQMATGKPASLIIPLSNANAAELAQNIKTLYAQKEMPAGVSPPQAEANPATNTLIVRGTQAQIDEIRKDLIDPLEAQIAAARQLQHKTYKLKFADPNGIQDAIGKLFRSDSKNPRDQVMAVAEYTSNSVIVSASPENLKRVETLLAQIDNAETSQQDVHVVEIKHADAASVARTLTDIYAKTAGRQGGGQAPPITIASVEGSRAILIRCRAEEFERIQATIGELDTEAVGTAGEVRVVTLLYSDAGEIASALEKYLRTTGSGGKLLGDARIGAMPQTNSVMISAAKEEVERLVDIAKGMDIAGEKGSVPQIIPLKYANVGMILPSVQEVFSESRGGGRRGQQPPVLVADEGSNAIIVRASPQDFTAIQGIVTQLDTEKMADKTPYRVVQVKAGINVTDLAEQVEATINETASAQVSGMKGTRPQSIMVTPNVRTNSLLIAGYAPLFDQAEALIKKLEEMGPSGDVGTRIVKVSNVKVDQIQKMIDQLTQPQQGGQGQRSGGSRSRPSSRPRP